MSVKTQLPKYDDIMKPTLEVLKNLGGSGAIGEIDDALTAHMGITQEQLNVTYPKSGAPVMPDRTSWARSFLKIAGLVANPNKGVWVLTDAGRKASDHPSAEIKAIVSKAYKASLAEKKAAETPDDGPAPSEDPVEWEAKLLARLLVMDASAFERLCQRLLRECGFTRVEVTGKSGDGGIDGAGVLRVGLISFQVLFQC